MFWNDPNLYSVAFKDIPNVPTPFYGGPPRFFHPYPTYLTPQVLPQMFAPQLPPGYFAPPITPQMFAPPLPPTYFAPPVTPQMFAPPLPPAYLTPPITPQMFGPQVPPYLHTPTPTPFVNPFMGPYNYTLPYFDRYRPLGQ
jgi:hypothetical protein